MLLISMEEAASHASRLVNILLSMRPKRRTQRVVNLELSAFFSTSATQRSVTAAGSNVLPTFCNSAIVVLVFLKRPSDRFLRRCSRHVSTAPNAPQNVHTKFNQSIRGAQTCAPPFVVTVTPYGSETGLAHRHSQDVSPHRK